MKTKFLSILTLLTLMHVNSIAQQKVALHSGGNTTIYGGMNPFVDAYNASATGDTIYLSGGAFTSPATIDKGLVIIGAGFHPDSTNATHPTIISNYPIYLGENSDSIHLEGLEIRDLYKSYNIQVNNLTITYCKFKTINLCSGSSPSVFSTDLAIIKSIVTETINVNGTNGSLFSNSILHKIENSHSNTFQNNIFLYSGTGTYPLFQNSGNNTIMNNIMNTDNIYIANANGNTFYNNIFGHLTPNLWIINTDVNNYKGIDMSTVYVNQTGNTFDYAHDYHLQPAAATLYLGNDGSEVGIYGGLFPFKEGAVPQNPHIQSKNIAPQTDNNGDLNIQIEVEAQNN